MLPKIPGDSPRNLGLPLEKVRVQVPSEEEGQRLDRILSQLLFWRSRASVQRLISEGRVFIQGGKKVRSSLKMKGGEILTILLPARPVFSPLPSFDGELSIVFEDQVVVVVDKPAGMTVHPAGRHLEDTLINALHRRYSGDGESVVVPRLCHRLDKETSGVILAAKDEQTRYLLGRQFEERTVEKTYLAVVEGKPERESGIIDWPLGPDSRSKVRMKMSVQRGGKGLAALTRYRVIKSNGRFSLLEVGLGTGRQHQIRVHLSALGHPVVGDKVYGPDETYFLDALDGKLSDDAKRRLVLPRHALHSWKLKFFHPAEERHVEVEAPMPDDMAALV